VKAFDRETYRVIQWATGHQGRNAIAMIASPSRPHLDLVGCWVHSPDKVGIDAGEIAGVGHLAVAATDDETKLLELDAECIVYSGFWSNIDLICRMLAAGKNVVTQVGPVYLRDGRRRAQIEAACVAGGTSFHAAGINTGFFSDRLCAALTTLNGSVEHISCVEYSHDSVAGLSDYMVFDAMGFGWSPDRLAGEQPALFGSLNDSAMFAGGDFVAHALGFAIDRRESDHRFALATQDVELRGRVVRAGTVAAVATTYRMYSQGAERLRFAQAWRIDPALDTGWGYDAHPKAFYQIEVKGKPSYTVLWEPDGDGMADALYATAATVVNAIPFVCDAEPGIRTTLDLPMIAFSGDLLPPSAGAA
jgi:4-hydroxy-tetrahydrodipicolinate reductase